MSSPGRCWPSETELAEVLGSRVKELRDRHEWSQRALSQQLRISKSMVAKYEGGVHLPPVGVLVRLAGLFGVTTDSLLRRDSLLGRELHDPRLLRCLQEIEVMDEQTRALVVQVLEAAVNVYRTLIQRGTGPEQTPR
jgi:transcriptional regulator with XRE-family HTH domain